MQVKPFAFYSAVGTGAFFFLGDLLSWSGSKFSKGIVDGILDNMQDIVNSQVNISDPSARFKFTQRMISDIGVTIKQTDLKNITEPLAMLVGNSSLDFTKALNLEMFALALEEKYGPFLDHLANYTRTGVFKQLQLLRNDFSALTGSLARQLFFRNSPWVALGLVVLFGTPLLVYYLYQKAKYNIGRPKLAIEVKETSKVKRTFSAISSAIDGVFKSVYSGVKWGIGAALGAVAALSMISLVDALYASIYEVDRTTLISDNILSDVRCNSMVLLGNEDSCNASYDHPVNFSAYLGLVAFAATCACLTTASKIIYKNVHKVFNAKPTAIFSPELTKKIDQIVKAAYLLKNHNGFFQNVLLYGPGGTGKTLLSKIIAKNSNMNYVMMSGGDLAQYIKRGEHVTELNKLFEHTKDKDVPTIIFIDEAESLCKDRGLMEKPEHIELLNAFLNHTGEPSNKIMLILATNRPQEFDPAVLSRLDHKIHVKPPGHDERQKILDLYVEQFFSEADVKEFFYEEQILSIATKIEGFTGRTIFKMLNVLASYKQLSEDNCLTQELINDVVDNFVQQEKEIVEFSNKEHSVDYQNQNLVKLKN